MKFRDYKTYCCLPSETIALQLFFIHFSFFFFSFFLLNYVNVELLSHVMNKVHSSNDNLC
jgi:hypothetical protein